MLFAAILVRIGFGGNVLSRGALALFERIRIAGHGLGFLAIFHSVLRFAAVPQIEVL